MEWLPIESAPLNTWILCASENGIVVEIVKKSRAAVDLPYIWERPRDKKYYTPRTFTHWMPLPDPPKDSEAS